MVEFIFGVLIKIVAGVVMILAWKIDMDEVVFGRWIVGFVIAVSLIEFQQEIIRAILAL